MRTGQATKPYNLKLVDRYHGMGAYLGIPETNDGNVYTCINDVGYITTWEIATGMGDNTGLQIRPQCSFNGETPYGYVGVDGMGNGFLTYRL